MKKTIILISYLCFTSIFSIAQTAESAKLDKLQRTVDSLTDLFKNSMKLSESTIRFTVGTNFSNLKTPDTRAYYARLSFYKDELTFKNVRTKKKRSCCERKKLRDSDTSTKLNSIPCDSFYYYKKFSPQKLERIARKNYYDSAKVYSGFAKRLDFGLYAGLFKQSYLDFAETPDKIFSKTNFSNFTTDSFTLSKKYYKEDSSYYYTDQIGFFVSPNVLLYKSMNKAENKYFTLRANVDFEFLQTIQTKQQKITFIDSFATKYNIDTFQTIIDSNNNSNTTRATGQKTYINQLYKGFGISAYYKDKNVEVLYKTTFGRVKIFNNTDSSIFGKNNYNTHYFCVTHLPSGIRIGGEIRNLYINDDDDGFSKRNNLLYNIYIAYSTDLTGLLARFPNKF
jgi:hypothetical protein